MSLPDLPLAGGCLCGDARYELTALPLGHYNCHCKDCQRMSGTGWAMSMPVRRAHLRHVSGALSAYDKPADSGRVVRMVGCARCGTRLWNEPLSAPDLAILRPGTLDDLSWTAPVGDIWTASRVPWARIDPDTPNYPGQPSDREALYAAWRKTVGLPTP